MKKRIPIQLLKVFFVILLGGQACTFLAVTDTQLPAATNASPTIPPHPSTTPSPNPTINPLSWYTPNPTLEPNAEAQMAELLQSKDCRLPCYLGITPGKTTITEAQTVLKGLDAFQYGTLNGSFGYSLDIGNPAIPSYPPTHYGLIYSSMSLKIESSKETVQSINIGISTERYKLPIAHETYREYWSRYSASGIFSELRKPDQLYLGIDYDKRYNSELIIAYENLGVLVRIRGSSQENNLCTINEEQEIFVTMDLFDPSSGLTIKDINPHLTPPYWLPIKEALGISVDEFYEQVLANPSICFVPKISNP